jgi:hypothetical protein
MEDSYGYNNDLIAQLLKDSSQPLVENHSLLLAQNEKKDFWLLKYCHILLLLL